MTATGRAAPSTVYGSDPLELECHRALQNGSPALLMKMDESEFKSDAFSQEFQRGNVLLWSANSSVFTKSADEPSKWLSRILGEQLPVK